MISPFEGRVTAHWRSYAGHAGMDIAPPRPGMLGQPVYSAFPMVIKKLHRTAKRGNRTSTWAPGRTGNGLLGANTGKGTSNDGNGNGYNHVKPLASLAVGDFVPAGALIGHNDDSGNQTGAHVHFEVWENHRDHTSNYDPRLAFKAGGIKAGSKPVLPGGNSKADNKAIQAALARMGYKPGKPDGVDGPMMKAAVRAFQRDAGLVEDGTWGAVSQKRYEALGRPNSRPKK